VHHVTELVGGQPVEYHVCEVHVQDVESLKPAPPPRSSVIGSEAFFGDAHLRQVWSDREAHEKIAAYLLPPLCLALLDPRP
jgi:hypothetical protein